MYKVKVLIMQIIIIFLVASGCDAPKIEPQKKGGKENPVPSAGTVLEFSEQYVLKLLEEKTHTLEVVKKPTEAGDTGAITYASNDDSIATVDPGSGEVTFVKAGEVTITATKAATPNTYKRSTAQYVLILGNEISWKKVSDASWTAREGFASVVFDGKLWVMGGQKQEGELNDVWYSEDGTTWKEATSSAGWSAREGLTSVVFDGKIWVMGGCSGTNTDFRRFGPEGNICRSNTQNYYNDIWSSSDGVRWNEEVANTPNDNSGTMWDTRAYHTAVVFKKKIYVIGGFAKNRHKWPDLRGMYVNDIWSSTDGKTWARNAQDQTEEKWHNYKDVSGVASARRFAGFTAKKDKIYWRARYGHASVVFDDKIWIIGGSTGKHQKKLTSGKLVLSDATTQPNIWPWASAYKNDAYSSTDGDIWTQELKNQVAGWPARRNHVTVKFQNTLYLIGGLTTGSGKDRVSVNDVWYSEDGTTWKEMSIDEAFMGARDNFQAVDFKGKLYVMGGGAKKSGATWTYNASDVDDQYNDVWAYGVWP